MPKTKTKKTKEKKEIKKPKKKTPAKKSIAKKTEKRLKAKPKKKEKSSKYIKAVGRRKTSTAMIGFYKTSKDKGLILINKKKTEEYFPNEELQNIIKAPLEKTGNKILQKGKIEISVTGGGIRGQAEAIRLGIARIILDNDSKSKNILKSHGFLTRDPRKKERKKFGLKKARKSPQWQKR